MTRGAHAATFAPTDVAGLVAAINTSNANGENDVIDLGGRTFTLTVVDNTTDGPNGLPSVLPDGGRSLTIRNGTIERDAAAPSFRILYVDTGATLAAESVTLRGGLPDSSVQTTRGGAVFNLGTFSVAGSTFLNNRAYPGSGGAIWNAGELSVTDCVYSGNSASSGGAVANAGTLSVAGTAFWQNFAEFDGGAIWNVATISEVRNSTFSGNIGSAGGAIYNQSSIGAISNSTFALNSGSDVNGTSGGVQNSQGGEILELASSILALSRDGGAGLDLSNEGVIGSAAYNLIGIGDLSGIADGVNGNQVGSFAAPIDPLLGPLADNGGPTFTHALLAGSPAIDRGSNPAVLAYDQRGVGFPRVSGARADAGAYEVQMADLSVTNVDTPDPVAPGGALTWTITVENGGTIAAETVQLSNPLPAGTIFVSLSAPAGWSCSTPAVGVNGAVSCSMASLPVGSATFTIVAAVDGSTPLGTVISNTATVTSVTPDPDSTDTSATTTTTIASPALLSTTKTVSGTFAPGGQVTYTIALTNAGPGAQLDNPGDELVDVLPAELSLVSAVATSGTAVATVGTNTVTWNGSIPAGGSVTITIVATVRATTLRGATVTNQATIAFDRDGNGTNEASGVSDDPATTAGGEPTVFVVADVATIPVLGGFGLSLLALLVAAFGALILARHFSWGRGV